MKVYGFVWIITGPALMADRTNDCIYAKSSRWWEVMQANAMNNKPK